MGDLDSKKDYKVGRGKPPPETQFKKGQKSANPQGRPKGSKSAAKIWDEILSRPVAQNTITPETNSREAIFLKAFHETLRGKLDNFDKLGGLRALNIDQGEALQWPYPSSFTLKLEDDRPSKPQWDWDDDGTAADETDMGTLN